MLKSIPSKVFSMIARRTPAVNPTTIEIPPISATAGFPFNAKCTGIQDDGITYVGEDGIEQKLTAGSVVIAAGMAPNNEEAMALFSSKYYTRLAGDCDDGGNIQKVLRSALGAACQV